MKARLTIKRVFAAILLLATVLPVRPAAANTAGIFVSPSASTVTIGSNVTVQVRINSTGNRFNAAEARLNFDSSRLQYVSHSSGPLTPLQAVPSGGSFYYAGASLGSSLSGNQLLFSVTFKTVATGSASLSINGAAAANDGEALSISASGGSVMIQEPARPGPSGGGAVRRPASQPSPDAGQPPALVGSPTVGPNQGSIALSLRCDVACRVRIEYKTGAGQPQAAVSDELKTSHEFILGRDAPLVPGTPYELSIILRSDKDVASQPIALSVRTKGVMYRVRLTDQSGRALANHPVQLHSDPVDAVTDANGIAEFNDVTPGEHTLVFDIDGITIRQPVQVGNPLLLPGGDRPQDVALPFRLAEAGGSTGEDMWMVAAFAAVGGGAAALILTRSRYTRAAARRVKHRVKNPKRIRPALKRTGRRVVSKVRKKRHSRQPISQQP